MTELTPRDYERICDNKLMENRLVVRKYSKSDSGRCFPDGTCIVPKAKDLKSLAVCLHEIGHWVMEHRNVKIPRWKMEMEAWDYAISEMKKEGIEPDSSVKDRMRDHLTLQFCKAYNRGMKDLPKELEGVIYPEVCKALEDKPHRLYLMHYKSGKFIEIPSSIIRERGQETIKKYQKIPISI